MDVMHSVLTTSKRVIYIYDVLLLGNMLHIWKCLVWGHIPSLDVFLLNFEYCTFWLKKETQ